MAIWTQAVTGLDQHLTTITFIGIRANTGQELVNQPINSATFDLKIEGSPTGTMTVQVYNSAEELQATSDSVSISTLTTSYESIVFDNISASPQSAGLFVVLALDGTFDTSNRVILSMGDTTPANTQSRYTTNSTWDNASGINTEFATMSVTYGTSGGSGTRLPPPPAFVRI